MAAADAATGAHWGSQKMPPALSPPTLSPRSRTTGPPVASSGFQTPSGPPRLFVDPFASGKADMVSRSSASMAGGDDLQPRDYVQTVSWKITTNGLMFSVSGGYTRTFDSCAWRSGLVCKCRAAGHELIASCPSLLVLCSRPADRGAGSSAAEVIRSKRSHQFKVSTATFQMKIHHV